MVRDAMTMFTDRNMLFFARAKFDGDVWYRTYDYYDICLKEAVLLTALLPRDSYDKITNLILFYS